jgi:predicted ATP-grasp superfamily ATP-dependent carboligase
VSISFDVEKNLPVTQPSRAQMNAGYVVIGFAEALSSPEVAWSLVDAGFIVAAFSRKGRKPALQRSRYVTIFDITAPEMNSDTAANDLLNLLNRRRANEDATPSILFPLDDVALWLSAQIALPPTWVLAGPDKKSAVLALNKSIQITAAKKAGLSVPETAVARTSEEVATRLQGFPLILKPADAIVHKRGSVSRGNTSVCADRQELDRALAKWNEEYQLLVQPYIAGVGMGVFGFADKKGVQCWSAHRRLRMMNPHGSGSSACASIDVPEDLKGPIQSLILNNGWRGLFMVELLEDHSGQHWFIEFNGRAWGSMALARRQGLEYPAWNAKLALDPEFSVPSAPPNSSRVVCRNLGRELMYLLFVLRGRKSNALRNWPSIWNAMVDVFRFRRGDYFYNFRRDDLLVFFSDCICTIRDQVFKPANRRQKA